MSISIESAGNDSSALFQYTRFESSYQSAYAFAETGYDFLDFLGVVQSLSVDFLSIPWQSELGSIGEGATAEVYQNPIDAKTAFAFKRLKYPHFDSIGSGLSLLLAEVSILGHFAIRNQQYIVNLEGICWDTIHNGEEVWPVLVFEKSHHGDLKEFMTSGPGTRLDLKERLEVLFHVLSGILMVHDAGKFSSILPCNHITDRSKVLFMVI